MKWERLLEAAPWGVRAMPRGGVMDGYFYIVSGRKGAFKIYSDTWRSPDGINWELMSESIVAPDTYWCAIPCLVKNPLTLPHSLLKIGYIINI